MHTRRKIPNATTQVSVVSETPELTMPVYKDPVIIGVGEVKNSSRSMEDAIEPLHLMISAIKAAAQDALPDGPEEIIKRIGGVGVVASSTWPYQDLPGSISEELGINPPHRTYSDLSGNSSVQLLDDTARLIAKGEIEMGIITGGEALASCTLSRICYNIDALWHYFACDCEHKPDLARIIVKTFMKMDNYPPPWTSPREHDKVYYANDTSELNGACIGFFPAWLSIIDILLPQGLDRRIGLVFRCKFTPCTRMACVLTDTRPSSRICKNLRRSMGSGLRSQPGILSHGPPAGNPRRQRLSGPLQAATA